MTEMDVYIWQDRQNVEEYEQNLLMIVSDQKEYQSVSK